MLEEVAIKADIAGVFVRLIRQVIHKRKFTKRDATKVTSQACVIVM